MIRGFVLAFVFVLIASPGTGHDLRGLSDRSITLANELNVSALTKLANQQPDPGVRYVLSRLLLWAPGQRLRGCFYEGTSEEKLLVTAAVKKLLDGKGVNIEIEFGTAPDFQSCSGSEELRVSFANGCCSAFIGRTSLAAELKNRPSIKLQGITKYSPEIAVQTVMHEFMHGLGLNHEHQSPSAPCKFKKDEILAAYGWKDKDYNTNMKQLEQSSRSYLWSSYDPSSIMKYYFDSSYLVDGDESKCFSKDNLLPSKRDYEGLRLAYPANRPPISAEQTRSAFDAIAASGASERAKALARELRKITP